MNILITGAFNWSEEQLEKLVENGKNTLFYQKIESQESDFSVECIDIVICNWYFVYHDIKKFSRLKFVQLLSAGMDRIDVDYCNQHGIKLYNARGVYSVPMAEYALSAVMQVLKKNAFFYENQKKHIWEKNRDIQELCGKNVLIVGTGSVGTETAKRFRVFTSNVNGVDLYPSKEKCYGKVWTLDKLDDGLKWADITILCLPLTEQTDGLFDSQRFEACKDDMIFVNIARGKIVDTDALIDALLNRKLSFAVLDVFEEEPLSEDSPLWNIENLIITPHNSFVGNNNNERMWNVIMDNLSVYWREIDEK